MTSDSARARATTTFEEAAHLDPDGFAAELDRGKLVSVTRNTWRHGEIASNVHFFLKQYARDNPGWSVAIGDPGTKLAHDPDLLRGPDVALIRAERRPTGSGAAGWLEGAPEVVVERAGDRQAASALAAKALEYLSAGAGIVWVIDPEPRRVMEFTPPDRVRILGPSDALEGGSILPGFRCEVAALFD